MSHIVSIKTEVRDVAAIQAAARRLGLDDPVQGQAQLFSGAKTGWQVQLPDWKYPIVIAVESGKIDYDNFNEAWGKQAELDSFLQRYAA